MYIFAIYTKLYDYWIEIKTYDIYRILEESISSPLGAIFAWFFRI